ncbi:winged helix DNA-binding domain-containing protein [Nocardioides marmoriginsengisoli]|uniref:Winged helix DNA-binding domain-containing protein n=1 Tax=Nocardioides marmoriginsengisoli TaxID=661483 RepID=A0A3N0CL15_9ACTN|nr:winged helix DNA-binding domain-containing protein [Nocardioides marmoriginsengisoli]RNL63716.1 winged helix DNA-binding domain-containing protein [Nocardioides marmoriginsengisoli]
MTTLSLRTLTGTLWLRQQLVPGQRSVRTVPSMVEHLLGLQAQDNLPPYLSLAARIDGFAPADLSDRLGAGELVRLLTMRGTVHVLTPDDALQLRGWVQPALDRQGATNPTSRPAEHLGTTELEDVLRAFLDVPRPLAAIGARLAEAFPDVPEASLKHVVRERLPLLQAPPRGQWKRSGGVVYAFTDRQLGRPFVEADVEELALRYLAAYGPATAADMTKWSTVTRLGPVLTALQRADRLVTYTDDHGRTLYDVPGAPLADESLDLPVTLLGKYDNLFLSHADRDRIAPDEARRRWMGVNGGVASAMFVDGLLAGLWRVEDGRAVVEPFSTPTKQQQRGIDAEVARVEELLAIPG